ncbi:hypothetical protein ETB97_000587 [Aspergillus alliaceus]|uniref:Uncharacterized protein n=1 Tax=Petromyces alliaceus TaxID=209559 RepID=A0A8H6A5H9_PETAA|nr:hypothetical protein ETB97_000587 [Aspergillus burnettii]
MLLSTVEVPASDLSPSSVRVRPLLLSLISNNLAYARTGEILLPAWGYATVLESTTDIALWSTLWGFWPTSGLPTDLTLVPGKPSGHWIEVSEHRKQLMTYYNRYVAVTSVPGTLEQAAEQRIAKHQLVTGPVKALAYFDVDQTVLWLARLKPSKLVVIDCDAPGDVLVQLRDLVQAHPEIQSAKFVIILVSGQQKVYTEADNRDWFTAIQQLGKIQSNASGAQDAAIEPDGPKEYFTRIHRRWEQWLDDRASTVPDRRLVWGKGVTGTEGLDGEWDRLTKGDVRPDEALVYMVYME